MTRATPSPRTFEDLARINADCRKQIIRGWIFVGFGSALILACLATHYDALAGIAAIMTADGLYSVGRLQGMRDLMGGIE